VWPDSSSSGGVNEGRKRAFTAGGNLLLPKRDGRRGEEREREREKWPGGNGKEKHIFCADVERKRKRNLTEAEISLCVLDWLKKYAVDRVA
jgi:hypothetical protein